MSKILILVAKQKNFCTTITLDSFTLIPVYLYLLCLFTPLAEAQSQRFKAGINIGLTAAQINGDESAEFNKLGLTAGVRAYTCLLYTSPSPRDRTRSRMPSSA